jgi:hypothetical protein
MARLTSPDSVVRTLFMKVESAHLDRALQKLSVHSEVAVPMIIWVTRKQNIWGLIFPRRWLRTVVLLSSGMWCRVVWWKCNDEEQAKQAASRPEDGSIKSLRNVNKFLEYYTASHSRCTQSACIFPSSFFENEIGLNHWALLVVDENLLVWQRKCISSSCI